MISLGSRSSTITHLKKFLKSITLNASTQKQLKLSRLLANRSLMGQVTLALVVVEIQRLICN
ncbi:hypothetical protein AVDCRST_MAG81-2304 [uncultured Synechococcales cyanobacterium]|uniref:Uncharacterized protein n=1 Tax=uncultured Synechococcales cyanobacterium TaxID=1936017 RepID=A0A6J4VCY9_9CYAN|nr:hypothetical protein AVDCRST_MAG81-2304 [uncultured Synechococcales cyanobacterium]